MSELNKTIRSLKRSLNEIESVKIDDSIYYNGNITLNNAKFNIESLINVYEEEYQKLHKVGAYND